MQDLYDLNGVSYEKTEWAECYSVHRDMSQAQLQKALSKCVTWWKKWRGVARNDGIWTMSRLFCEHVFRKQGTMFLEKNFDYVSDLKRTSDLALAFKQLMIQEFREMKAFYNSRKESLAISQKEHAIAHSRETVACTICGAHVTRKNIAKHKRTNKRCLEEGGTSNN
jgi:hypothetical protein